MRKARYLAPNLITTANLVFGLASLALAYHGNWRLSGWMIIYAVLCDRLDGMVARRLHATSAIGVQLDSFADFLNFGVAPAFLLYTFLTSPDVLGQYDLPYADGWGRIYLFVGCVIWVLGAVFRLARFNVNTDEDKATRIYFGIPTTLAGGLLVTWFLAFLKYRYPGPPTFGGPKLFGDTLTTPRGVWLAIPGAMLVGAYLMASSLKMLKIGKAESRFLTGFLLACAISGYVVGWMQVLPEYLIWMPTIWVPVFLVWGWLAEEARALQPPPWFPEPRDPSA